MLSDQGLRELHRFVLDLTRREAARAENRRRAAGAASLPRRGDAARACPPAASLLRLHRRRAHGPGPAVPAAGEGDLRVGRPGPPQRSPAAAVPAQFANRGGDLSSEPCEPSRHPSRRGGRPRPPAAAAPPPKPAVPPFIQKVARRGPAPLAYAPTRLPFRYRLSPLPLGSEGPPAHLPVRRPPLPPEREAHDRLHRPALRRHPRARARTASRRPSSSTGSKVYWDGTLAWRCVTGSTARLVKLSRLGPEPPRLRARHRRRLGKAPLVVPAAVRARGRPDPPRLEWPRGDRLTLAPARRHDRRCSARSGSSPAASASRRSRRTCSPACCSARTSRSAQPRPPVRGDRLRRRARDRLPALLPRARVHARPPRAQPPARGRRRRDRPRAERRARARRRRRRVRASASAR